MPTYRAIPFFTHFIGFDIYSFSKVIRMNAVRYSSVWVIFLFYSFPKWIIRIACSRIIAFTQISIYFFPTIITSIP